MLKSIIKALIPYALRGTARLLYLKYLKGGRFSLNDIDKKLEKYLNYDNGFYVELGANDGFTQSNSYYFELKRNWKQGVYTINTPRTQAATGWIGGESISLGNIQVQVKTLNASVVVQSLDEAPLGRSQNLMISLGARAIPQDNDKTPFYVEPLEGTLTLQAPQGLTLFTQGIMGQMKKLPAK